jgi:hypothetical protein
MWGRDLVPGVYEFEYAVQACEVEAFRGCRSFPAVRPRLHADNKTSEEDRGSNPDYLPNLGQRAGLEPATVGRLAAKQLVSV